MKLRHRTISAVALILMAACTDLTGVDDATGVDDETGVDDATAVELTDLAGTWTATAIVFTQTADPMASVDQAANGAAMTLTMTADGTYARTFVFPGDPTQNETGTYTVSDSTLTVTPTDGPPEAMGILRNDDTLTLTLADIYDFDGDQVEEDATLVITLTRTEATDPTDPTGVEPDDLAGTWTATAIVFTQTAAPMASVDQVANGAAMTLTMTADGTYAWTFVFPGDPTENETGTYTVSGSTLTVTPTDGPPEAMGILRNDDTLMLTLADIYDFDGDQVEEDATLVITLTRTEATDPTDPTGVEPDDLAGTWTATAIVFTQIAAPMASVDQVANGAAMTLTMTADGTYAWTFVFPGDPTENETGTYTVSGSTLTVTPTDGPPEAMGILRNDDTLMLTLADIYDFDGDQVEEDATLVITLTR